MSRSSRPNARDRPRPRDSAGRRPRSRRRERTRAGPGASRPHDPVRRPRGRARGAAQTRNAGVIPLSVDEVLALDAGTLRLGAEASRFTGVTIDSRAAGPGDLFVAVGRGSEFVADALAERSSALARRAFAASRPCRAVRLGSDARVVGLTAPRRRRRRTSLASHRSTGAISPPRRVTQRDRWCPFTRAESSPTRRYRPRAGDGGRGQSPSSRGREPGNRRHTSGGQDHLELLGTPGGRSRKPSPQRLFDGGVAVVHAGVPCSAPRKRDLEVTASESAATSSWSIQSTGGDRGSSHGLRHEPDARAQSASLQRANALAALVLTRVGLPLELAKQEPDIVLSPLREEEFELEDGSLILKNATTRTDVDAGRARSSCRARRRRRGDRVLGEQASWAGWTAPPRDRSAAAEEASSDLAVGRRTGLLDGADEVPRLVGHRVEGAI